MQRQHRKKDSQRFGQCSSRIVCKEWAQRCQQKCSFSSTLGKKLARHVCDQEACGKVHKNLNDQDCPIVFHPKNRKHQCEKCGINRQPNISRNDGRSISHTISSMSQPVFDDIAIDERIRCDHMKDENEQQPQSQACKRCQQKTTEMTAEEGAHSGIISAS